MSDASNAKVSSFRTRVVAADATGQRADEPQMLFVFDARLSLAKFSHAGIT